MFLKFDSVLVQKQIGGATVPCFKLYALNLRQKAKCKVFDFKGFGVFLGLVMILCALGFLGALGGAAGIVWAAITGNGWHAFGYLIAFGAALALGAICYRYLRSFRLY